MAPVIITGNTFNDAFKVAYKFVGPRDFHKCLYNFTVKKQHGLWHIKISGNREISGLRGELIFPDTYEMEMKKRA